MLSVPKFLNRVVPGIVNKKYLPSLLNYFLFYRNKFSLQKCLNIINLLWHDRSNQAPDTSQTFYHHIDHCLAVQAAGPKYHSNLSHNLGLTRPGWLFFGNRSETNDSTSPVSTHVNSAIVYCRECIYLLKFEPYLKMILGNPKFFIFRLKLKPFSYDLANIKDD